MAFLQLEDSSGNSEIILFPKTYKKVEQWLDGTYQVFIVKGALDVTALPKCKIKADECIPIELVLQEWTGIKKATFDLPLGLQEATLEAFKQQLVNGAIPLEFTFQEHGIMLRLTTTKKIALDKDIIQTIEQQSVMVSITL